MKSALLSIWILLWTATAPFIIIGLFSDNIIMLLAGVSGLIGGFLCKIFGEILAQLEAIQDRLDGIENKDNIQQ